MAADSQSDSAVMHANRIAMARDLVTKSRSGSTNRLARELGIQYAYARRIMQDLEESGLVSAPDKRGARTVASCVSVSEK
ncbi:DNA translocase FtsK [Sphingobium indicum]|uniref:DNA translocase FtsK n=1 Tax=Sphingobium TaxID=165695 RepID=UPI0009FCBFD7|nr:MULTISPECIES: DNA translocase FtsK [Sphingobium]MCB4863167.1 Rrf2 family transcriptional regulator [Sphingobium sp. PNB]UXC90722.1 Rrf2 family transcriptional regulator [Sphingobium sp. RSMS]